MPRAALGRVIAMMPIATHRARRVQDNRELFEATGHKVRARQADRREWIAVDDDKTVEVWPGEWIVMLNLQIRFVLPDRAFRALYRRCDN